MRAWATRYIELRFCLGAYVLTPSFARSLQIVFTLFSHALSMTPQPLQLITFQKSFNHAASICVWITFNLHVVSCMASATSKFTEIVEFFLTSVSGTSDNFLCKCCKERKQNPKRGYGNLLEHITREHKNNLEEVRSNGINSVFIIVIFDILAGGWTGFALAFLSILWRRQQNCIQICSLSVSILIRSTTTTTCAARQEDSERITNR